MENKEKTEILDKLEELKRIEDEFEGLFEQEDKPNKIKKIVYTTRGSVEKVISSTIAIRTISLKNQGVKGE